MSTYHITLAVSCEVTETVEAANQSEAKEKAFDQLDLTKLCENGDCQFDVVYTEIED